MCLSEKIMDLRKRSGWSQEELAERLGISRQSVSKWETGESVPDLDKIIRMSELWKVSTDYLLKEGESLSREDRAGGEPQDVSGAASVERAESDSVDDMWRTPGGRTNEGSSNAFYKSTEFRSAGASAGASSFGAFDGEKQGASWERASAPPLREVSRAEALDFLAVSRYASPRIALGVMLCILSPICLLLLGSLSEASSVLLKRRLLIPENLAGGVGMSVLLIFVAVAVGIFITTGMKLTPYEFLEKESFVMPEDVLFEVSAERADYESTFRAHITIGVLLCVLSAIPLFVSSMFFIGDFAGVVGLCILLVFVAVGVFFLVSAGIIHGSHEKLLQTGDYAPKSKRANKKTGAVAGVFWCAIVSIYLLMSFTTMSWDRTWIIFPVAGVLFGGISALIHATSR